MRIEGDAPGVPQSECWLYLTLSEAKSLKRVLDFMCSDEADLDPQWHAHIDSDDEEAQLTVAWNADRG